MKRLFFSLFLLSSFAGFAQYFESEVSFQWKSDSVYGTLLSPVSADARLKKQKLVIFISGSGPTDRDGNSSILPGPNNSIKFLADSLVQYGISSFRYDKIAIGKSTYSGTEEDLRFGDNVEVVINAINALRDKGYRSIYLAGHSQGSLVGILAAQEAKVAGFISLEGSGSDALSLIKSQLEINLPEAMRASAKQKLDSIAMGYTVTSYSPMLHSLFRPSVQPYLYSYLNIDPSAEIKKLKVPVLIVQGGRDLQTPEDEGRKLKAARPEAEYLYYPSMNHVLKQVDESDEQNRAAYYDPDFPLAKDLAKDIGRWIKDH